RGFDLSRAPLMRLSLIRTADESYRFSWSFHHILLDGWSTPQVIRELFEHYRALAAGSEVHLPEPRPYRDYIAWLADREQTAAEAFWRRALDGLGEPTLLASGRVAGASGDAAPSGYGDAELGLSEATTQALQDLAQGHRLTLNALFQAVWALLLSRYAGAGDVVFGITVSGRPAALGGVETMVGM
ncbi:MAG: non-ribosomal peptide synthetase, partial [FCB group bacterium]|nr:non-ribosomal peptide synthetase [FCB group bacterium]